jgi:hypothetical protein
MLVVFFLAIIIFVVYSYSLVDPNLTIISHPLWEQFRNAMVQLGYYNRSTSWLIYLGCVLAFFAFHLYFINSKKKVDVLRVILILPYSCQRFLLQVCLVTTLAILWVID